MLRFSFQGTYILDNFVFILVEKTIFKSRNDSAGNQPLVEMQKTAPNRILV
jgi:hypothetical protein